MTVESWKPLASLSRIKQRAALLTNIRSFMEQRAILEVDTPILGHYAVTDPYIESLKTKNVFQPNLLYLHTSPEYCMKRLLAAGTGSIYQIAHVFRDAESGSQHQTEFSMLEWYRVGFDYQQLMDEVAELLMQIGLAKPVKKTYEEMFLTTVKLNPHTATLSQLQKLAGIHGWGDHSNDRHALLDYIFSQVVIKNSVSDSSILIYDYPECMAALATIKTDEFRLAERFELFIDGTEIANGFNELCDADEQQQRFIAEQQSRKEKGLKTVPIDPQFIAALRSGLPRSAGVAVGIERLLMVLSETNKIKNVLTFTLDNN